MPDADTPHRPPWYRNIRSWVIASVLLVIVAGTLTGVIASRSGPSEHTTVPETRSPPTMSTLRSALFTASTAEQEMKATYDAVIAKFGEVQPFSRMSHTEGRHVATLTGVAEHYGVGLPSGFSGQPPPATVGEACEIAVATEQNMVEMYTQLLTEVAGNPELTQVFSNLQGAALINHLPAFERCLSRTSGPSASSVAESALFTASTAEQEAAATYAAVVAKFGAVGPFSTVSETEHAHVAALGRLAQDHGVTTPRGPFPGLHAPATFSAACQIGMDAEHDIIAMYSDLLFQVSGQPDLTSAFADLKSTSEHHLSAFERCA